MERRLANKQTHLPLPQSLNHSGDGYGAPAQWRFNWLRALRLTAFACFVFAPVTKAWFELLVRLFPGDGVAVAVPRMVADQLIYAPCVLTSVFMWTGLLESAGSWSFAVNKLRSNFWPALKANWCLWPAVQLINQGIIPLHYRMLVAAAVNVPWTAYLASKAAAPPTTAVSTSSTSTSSSNYSNKISSPLSSLALSKALSPQAQD